MEPGGVTATWLSDRLGAEVRAIRQQRIGDGLVGMNLRVELVDADPGLPESVVVKLPSPDPTSRSAGIALRTYEREVCFYQEIAPTVDIRMPRCHHAEWDPSDGEFALVLEDMRPAETGDQIAGCEIGRARAAVAELARLHGPRWDDPELEDVDWLQRRSGPDDVAQLQGLWDMFVPGFLAGYAHHLTAEAIDLVDSFGAALTDWVNGRVGAASVTHGDYRLDNLLFGTTPSCPPVTVVDWQTPGHGPAVADLSYFCGAGLLPEHRRAHERELVDLYGQGLAEYGVDLDETWLWEQYRRDAFGGVIMTVIASQVVGRSDRSEAMFAAMGSRHAQHALDLDARSLI